jgi:heterotetrameric sarcosine oxidase delta subunit
MQLFPCPFCGPRPDAEFHYAGDAGKPRPARECSDAEWAHYLLMRDNVRGAARELWIHAAGCGRWIEFARDTATHAVAGAEPLNR